MRSTERIVVDRRRRRRDAGRSAEARTHRREPGDQRRAAHRGDRSASGFDSSLGDGRPAHRRGRRARRGRGAPRGDLRAVPSGAPVSSHAPGTGDRPLVGREVRGAPRRAGLGGGSAGRRRLVPGVPAGRTRGTASAASADDDLASASADARRATTAAAGPEVSPSGAALVLVRSRAREPRRIDRRTGRPRARAARSCSNASCASSGSTSRVRSALDHGVTIERARDERLHDGGHRQREERSEEAGDARPRDGAPEGDRRVQLHRLRGDARAQDVVLELLVQHEEDRAGQRIDRALHHGHDAAAAPSRCTCRSSG